VQARESPLDRDRRSSTELHHSSQAAEFRTRCSGAVAYVREYDVAVVELWGHQSRAEASIAVTSRPSRRLIWRRCRRCRKHVWVVFAMWARILISMSNCTPRSRTVSAGVIVFVPTTMVRSDDGVHCSEAVVPNHITSVLDGFSCSLRAPHQFATSTMQFCSCVAAVAACGRGTSTYACVSSAKQWWCNWCWSNTSSSSSV